MSTLITSGQGTQVRPVSTGRSLQINLSSLTLLELGPYLSSTLKNGGVAGIICNTVSNAITVQNFIETFFSKDEIFLSHSRFTSPDRMNNDLTVLDIAGKNSDRPYRKIVIGTQILEQSLDVDFDILISEPAPIESFIQRSGRLHRHSRSSRPELVKEPRLITLLPDGILLKTESTLAVYGEWLMELSKDCFSTKKLLRLPDDIKNLVEHQHGNFENIQDEYNKYKALVTATRAKTRPFLLDRPSARLDKPLNGMLSILETDDPSEAKVRGGDSGPEIIAIFSDADNSLWVPFFKGKERKKYYIKSGTEFNNYEAIMMLNSTLRLPLRYNRLTYLSELEGQMDPFIRERWKNSSLLKQEIALVFNSSGTSIVKDRSLSYSSSTGLEDNAISKL